MNSGILLCWVEDIPDGESRGFDPWGVGRDTLFIVRKGDALYGWQDRCPHEGDTPLPWKRHAYLNAKRTRIVCFAHGAQFDIATGVCVLGVCLGKSLSSVDLRVMPSGEVFLYTADSFGVPGPQASNVTPECQEDGDAQTH